MRQKPKQNTEVKHSKSKDAWNVVGIYKYKIAVIPYSVIEVVDVYGFGRCLYIKTHEYAIKWIMNDVGMREGIDYEIFNDDLNDELESDKIRLTKRGCRKLIMN